MIPKIIHYCWFGRNPLPQSAKKCIRSWKKYFPDYEIKEWNEDNFDVNVIPYTKEAYAVRKYAFVSDFARFWILYHYGGIYFDTDVEVIKPMDDIIAKGAFMGREYDGIKDFNVAPGLGIGCEVNNVIYKEILDMYATLHFVNEDGTLNNTTVVLHITRLLEQYGLKRTDDMQVVASINIYPKEYFSPKQWDTFECKITNNTYSIHHYDSSWLKLSYREKLRRKLISILGYDRVERISNMLGRR